MDKYTAALVGLGRIGYSLGLDKKREQPASHTMALLNNSRINLIAGCDTDPINLAKWQEANKKALVYSCSANLYTRYCPDIVAIAVNEDAHLKESLDAISAKPRLIILEKPVALNMADAKKIQNAATENNVPILVNHERRFAEDYKLAKSYIKNIGELQSIKAELSSSLCVYNPKEEQSGEYSLIHDGTHLVDIVLFFLEDEAYSSLKNISIDNFAEKKGLLSLAKKLNETSVQTKCVNSILHNPLITCVYKDENKNVRQLSAPYTPEK